MQKRQTQWLSLLAVVLLAGALRIYNLRDVPAGLFCDEAALGYNAHAIATAGMDENGVRFPLFVWSFGVSYKNPLYIYAAALPVKLLGLDEFSIRLTSALFGIGTVIAIFFLGRALFTPWVGLFAALFLAVCPWHLHFSRIAFELISFPFVFIIGLTLLVRFTQGRRTLPAAMFFFGLGPYGYAVADVFVPLFLIGFTVLYLPMLLRRFRESLLAFIVLIATVAPVAVFLYQHPQAGTQYIRNTTNLRAEESVRQQADRLWNYYQQFVSREFLFERGDQIVRHSVRGFGELLPFYAPFLLLGAAVALLKPDRASKLVLWWVAVYPVAPSLMTEIPSASRGFIGAPAFSLLTAIGFASTLRALGWAARWRPLALTLQTAAIGVAGYFLVPQVASYLRAYFIEYPKYSAPTYGGFQYGYRDVIHHMESQRSNYDLLMLTATEVNQPQIFPLFYNRVDPRDWHARHDLGYMVLDPSEYGRYSMNQRILYALRPSNLALFTDYTVQREVTAPGGQTEFVIAEVRARKRFLTNWLGLGLFDNAKSQGVAQDFIDVHHLPREPIASMFGPAQWERIQQQFVAVDLNRHFAAADPRTPGNPEWVCAYAVTTVRAPAAQTAYLEVSGSDDQFRFWLNGQTLTGWPMVLSSTPVRRPIQLRAGDNALLVKGCDTIGSWDFVARLTDTDGHDLVEVTTVPELPAPGIEDSAAAQKSVQLVEGFDSIVRFERTNQNYPDYRGGTESWAAGVREPNTELVWRSAPCPAKQSTVLALTASMSDDTGEADMYVNGQRAVSFALGSDRRPRAWSAGEYRVAFVSRTNAAGNSGFLLIQVPAEHVVPGQPLELRVVPVRGHADAWFMVKSYRDTIAHEQITPEAALETLDGAWSERVETRAAH
ncbi:MAG TPA: glycosyltransferase family 39 protein [Candidatus Binatia bacterium]|nr:glycosyltransferase family 39 protein [Candidatus Binatia bacterium]